MLEELNRTLEAKGSMFYLKGDLSNQNSVYTLIFLSKATKGPCPLPSCPWSSLRSFRGILGIDFNK